MRTIGFALAAFWMSGAAGAAVVVPFYGSFGDSAYGDYVAGDRFTGEIVYDRVYNEPEDGNLFLVEGLRSLTFHTRLTDYTADVIYGSYTRDTRQLDFAGQRSMPLLQLTIDDVSSAPTFLPTAAQLAGKRGTLSFSDVRGVLIDDEFEPFFSGGSGTLTVGIAAVPEPASWATMVLGIGVAGGTMRVRARRRQRADA